MLRGRSRKGHWLGTVIDAREAEWVRPTWPAVDGRQQMIMHLDIEVGDLEAAVSHALELGATLADFQPQKDVRVLLDPAGHPFCLYVG
jgi:hypothetical protein